MFTHALNPTLFHLGPLEIRWYGLMYLLAFFITFYYARWMIRQGKLAMTEKQLDSMLGAMILYMIIGARLFYAIFYNPSYFIEQPLKFFAVWEGGLSFHGGLLGVLLAAYIYAKRAGVPLLRLADVLVVPIALGNALGRIGNFINGELYGVPTDLPWGVVFAGVDEARHPTQLYEAAYNLVIFVVLFSLRDRFKRDGMLFGLFLTLYSIFRFGVEFIKDLPLFGPLTMGQWLTIPVFLVGLYILFRQKP